MVGKKKSLANKLARMTDEERARYLQRKADIEEEARRRKEQLISTFMKNKIKKEDGFSRLNVAKINQNWHQILRFNKCKEMKEDVEHMKKSIEKVIDYKNRTIEKLMEELEMAEEQYSHNFQAHMSHIDQTIDNQNQYIQSMDNKFQEEMNDMLESHHQEEKHQLETADREQKHLKIMIFGLQSTAKQRFLENRERYLQKKEEITSTFRTHFDAFVKHREGINAAIWRQIATIVKAHVHYTDNRRLHLAELRRLDAESAAEITANQERITQQEDEIGRLKKHYAYLTKNREEKIKSLKHKSSNIQLDFVRVRKEFRKEHERDEKKIIFLTRCSNNAIHYLEKINLKGLQIATLVKTCKKFETLQEQDSKWLPIFPAVDDLLSEEYKCEEELKNMQLFEHYETKSRDSSAAKEVVKKIVICEKSPPSSPQPTAEDRNQLVANITQRFTYLLELERFWLVFGKVELQFEEIKKEKCVLSKENKGLRGMLRAILEAAVLAQSVPSSKVATRVASKSTACRSAPIKRILI